MTNFATSKLRNQLENVLLKKTFFIFNYNQKFYLSYFCPVTLFPRFKEKSRIEMQIRFFLIFALLVLSTFQAASALHCRRNSDCYNGGMKDHFCKDSLKAYLGLSSCYPKQREFKFIMMSLLKFFLKQNQIILLSLTTY